MFLYITHEVMQEVRRTRKDGPRKGWMPRIFVLFTEFFIYLFYLFILFVPHSWVSGLTQQAVAQLIGDLRYLRFNVLIREDAKGSPFTDVNAKAALSSQLF